jgi:hypothetical protein
LAVNGRCHLFLLDVFVIKVEWINHGQLFEPDRTKKNYDSQYNTNKKNCSCKNQL